MKKITAFIFGIMLVSMVMPFSAFADIGGIDRELNLQQGKTDGGVGSSKPEESTFQLVPCQGVDNPATKEKETECDFNMLLVGVNRMIKLLLFLSIPLVMGMGIYTAYKFMTAGGDPGKLADAKKMFVPIVIGLFWVLAAYIVVYTFLDKLVSDSIKNDATSPIKILDNR